MTFILWKEFFRLSVYIEILVPSGSRQRGWTRGVPVVRSGSPQTPRIGHELSLLVRTPQLTCVNISQCRTVTSNDL